MALCVSTLLERTQMHSSCLNLFSSGTCLQKLKRFWFLPPGGRRHRPAQPLTISGDLPFLLVAATAFPNDPRIILAKNLIFLDYSFLIVSFYKNNLGLEPHFGNKSINKDNRASLVAQWLRICLLMQGTRVRALVWEDPTCHGAAGPVSHNC